MLKDTDPEVHRGIKKQRKTLQGELFMSNLWAFIIMTREESEGGNT